MNILFVCHRLPFPPNRGGKIRPFHMIQHLGRKHSVTVASLAHTQHEFEQGAGLKEFCAAVLAEVLPNSLRWMQAGAALPSNTPSSVAYFRSARLHRRVQQAWQQTRFDVVMVHCAFAAQYVLGLRGGFRILDFGDLDSAKWFDYSEHRALPLSLGYRTEARKLRRYEKQLAGQFDQCTVTTPGELEEFKTLQVAVPCQVIPNGVDAGYFHPRSPRHADSSLIAFLGRMDYFPNVDGAAYCARAIFPIIRRSLPRSPVRCLMFGRCWRTPRSPWRPCGLRGARRIRSSSSWPWASPLWRRHRRHVGFRLSPGGICWWPASRKRLRIKSSS